MSRFSKISACGGQFITGIYRVFYKLKTSLIMKNILGMFIYIDFGNFASGMFIYIYIYERSSLYGMFRDQFWDPFWTSFADLFSKLCL